MKRKDKLAKTRQVNNRQLDVGRQGFKFVLLLMALTVLCMSAVAQEKTASDWAKKGKELLGNGSKEEGIQALDKALQLYNESINQNLKYSKAWLGKAEALNLLGKFNESLIAYDKVLEIDSKSADALSSKGLILFQMGRYNESLEASDKALQINPKDYISWGTKATILAADMGRYNESLDAYDRAIETWPANDTYRISELWVFKGNTLQEAGRPKEAFKAYDEAIRISSQNFDAWVWKGDSLKNLGQYNESLQAYDKAIEVAPSQMPEIGAFARVEKADVLLKMGRYEEAYNAYNRTIELNSTENIGKFNSAWSWRGMGSALAGLGRYNESLQAFNKSREVDPKSASEAWSDEGNALKDMGKYEQAVVAYNKSIETAPSEYASAKAWIGKGNALDGMGKHDEAVKAYEKAINNLDKTLQQSLFDGETWYLKGTTLKSLGRIVEADGALAKAKELGYGAPNIVQENTSQGWFKKGQELDRNGSYEKAVEAYDRAIDLEPNNATLYIAKVPSLNVLATIINNQSKLKESMETVNKALQIDPKNPNAWELKGEVFSLTKRYNESLEAYDKAIENISSYRQDSRLNQTEFLSYIWTSKSISLWQLTRYNESLEAIDKAVQIDPAGNYDAWAFKGELLASVGRYNESLQALDGALAIGTASSRPELEALPLEKEGYVLMQMGRYEEADQIYEKMIGLNLTDDGADRRLANAWRGRGNALAKLGEYNESLQAFDRAIELNSEIAPYAWTGKGDALLASGRYDEAIIAYDRVLKLYPEFADIGIAHAQKGKGDSLTRLDKSKEALAAYGAAISASDKAITAFNNATPLDKAISFTFDPYPLDKEFWNNRGSILKILGRQNHSNAVFAKAKELGYRR